MIMIPPGPMMMGVMPNTGGSSRAPMHAGLRATSLVPGQGYQVRQQQAASSGINVEGAINSGLMWGNHAMLATMMGLPLLSGAVGLVGKGVGKVGLPGHTALSTTADYINRPSKMLFSEEAMTLNHLGDLTHTRGIGGAIGGALSGVTAGAVEAAEMIPGVKNWRTVPANFYARSAARHHEYLASHLAGISSNAVAVPEFAQAMGELHSAIGGHVHELNPERAAAALKQATELAEKGGQTKVVAALTKVGGSLEKTIARHTDARLLHNLPGEIRSMPKNMGKMGAGHALNNSLIIGGTVMSMYGTARGLNGRMEALREMYCDLTGRKPEQVNMANLFFDRVPQPVAAARNHLLREFGPRLVFEAGNAVLNASWMLKGSGSMLTFMALMAAGQLFDSIAGESVLEYYKNFKEANKRGEQVPVEYYEAFLGLAVPELHKRGGTESDFTKALALQYVNEAAGPQQIVQESVDGRMKKRIEHLQSHYMQAKAAHEAGLKGMNQAEPAAPAAPQERPGSHVAALESRGTGNGYTEKLRAQRTALGKHTGEIARENVASVTAPPTLGM